MSQTLCEAFQATAKEIPNLVALRTTGDAVSIKWQEYADRVRRIAAGLAAQGVKRGDTVGIMLTNRPEFHLVDTGALHLGAVPFSVYNTSAPEQLAYVFSNAGNSVVVTEKAFLPTLRATGADLKIVCVDGAEEGTTTLADLEAAGDPDFDFEAAWRAVEPGDLATIIYTSGTTGPPKGVELTHRNVLAVADAVRSAYEVDPGDRVLSFLPSAHIADRVISHYLSMLFGTIVTSVADPKQLAAALPDARPHVFFAVPRVWQKFKLAIETGLAAEPSGAKRKIAGWALDVGRKVAKLQLADEPVPAALGFQHKLADKLVLSKLRKKLGLDEAKVPASGAAAIPVDTMEYFWGIGIPVYEIWGMSETGGLGTSCRAGQVKLGTVGTPVHGAEVTLADDGELLIRAASVMRGYRNDPTRTAETIDTDGWVHTGDIGVIDADGYVTIVDRKKELIINSSGKNMSPTNIENAVKAASSLIGQVVAIGDDRPYVSALIVVDQDAAAGLAAKHGLDATSPSAVLNHEAVRTLITDAVRKGNATLSRVEQIKRFRIVPGFWEPGGDELTPTLKLRRKPIAEKYAHDIDDLYADSPTPETINVGS
ncbi:Long-chain acyl-CoA synthetase (AMP-forming) [Actinokineospora alba]|uniref:Acyl-CoA synthetase n=1 Tax=Actinokineospora alba TaxID=504798 RepID=A0A1H0HVL0_9PSEU|nr:long-chain fatty acid--CoA ligase [Actinokineospora alba]TDP64740.1 long-subunit acyl-CoA synthetase (AMP-forming) [Actinokineospora alba]SDH44580.1 Long-chain acyl-CoA synthetase (AMP-forming) [Actinokineospora alba]SDO22801.1 Long-chain acyl-CoA synthetase (AMP-forming) [Actinokineospora alba]